MAYRTSFYEKHSMGIKSPLRKLEVMRFSFIRRAGQLFASMSCGQAVSSIFDGDSMETSIMFV